MRKTKDFINFNLLITPKVIQIIFLLISIIAIATGIFSIIKGKILEGLLSIVLIPIIVRIILEITLIAFKQYNVLASIHQILDSNNE